MVKTTLVFSVHLIALGLVGYFGTGSLHPTALIPAWIGIAMGFGGLLAISPSESRRKLFMHINVSIGVLGLLGSAVEVVRSYVHGTFTDNTEIIAMASKLALTTLLLIYVYLCMRSFIAVRRSGKV